MLNWQLQAPACFVGVHHPDWLADPDMPPMCVSLPALHRIKGAWPTVVGPVIVDSGAFSALSGNSGRWRVRPDTFAWWVRRVVDWAGPNLMFVGPQDFMCEPHILAKAERTVEHHQVLTVEWLVQVRRELPEHYGAKISPALQGWTVDDYLRHWSMYEDAGIDLCDEPVVGVGSICRRNTREGITDAADVLVALGSTGELALHAYGINANALDLAIGMGACYQGADTPRGVVSYDSMAWSLRERHRAGDAAACGPLFDVPAVRYCHLHEGPCNNCPTAAVHYWHARTERARAALADAPQWWSPSQGALF